MRPCPVSVLHALSCLLRRRPAHKGMPWAVPSLLRTFTVPGEGPGLGSRPASACPVSSYRPGHPACVSGPGRPGTGSGGMSCAAGMGHSEAQRGMQAASCESVLWPKVHSGSTTPGAAQQEDRHNRQDRAAGGAPQSPASICSFSRSSGPHHCGPHHSGRSSCSRTTLLVSQSHRISVSPALSPSCPMSSRHAPHGRTTLPSGWKRQFF